MVRVATFSDDQVEVIIMKAKQGQHKKDLAFEYGVSRQAIYKSIARYENAEGSPIPS